MADEISEKTVFPKAWGSEEWIANNLKYCGKLLNLERGKQCSIHYHKNKHETFYVLSGEILMEIGGQEGITTKKILKKGEVQIVEPMTKHRFTGLKNSVIIEFSTHHEESDSYRDTNSGSVDLKGLLKELKEGGIING